MYKPLTVLVLTSILSLTLYAGPMKAGMAKVVITPPTPIMLAGYAARKSPAESRYQDLYAKALAIWDDRDRAVVIVTADILGFTDELTAAVSEAAKEKYGLQRDQIIFNSSHTHSGPVIRKNLIGAYQLNAEQATKIHEYTLALQEKLVWVIGKALREKTIARLSLGSGQADFAVNRRQSGPEGIRIGVNPGGPVDKEVPVLMVESNHDVLLGVIFLYACHNTTLTDSFNQLSGDYAGFAQNAFEQKHPGSVAMFVQGCGGDVNPNPRGTLELATSYGNKLAEVVDSVIAGKLREVKGPVRTAYEKVLIGFDKLPSKEELTARLSETDVFRRRHAERMLARLERDGSLRKDYAYPVQVLQIGGDFTFVALGGEVVTDYALRIKKELGGKSLFVAGYSNDVMGYIPSQRMFSEGGYEVDASMIYYDLPTRWNPGVEEVIFSKVLDLVRVTGGRK